MPKLTVFDVVFHLLLLQADVHVCLIHFSLRIAQTAVNISYLLIQLFDNLLQLLDLILVELNVFFVSNNTKIGNPLTCQPA